MLLVNSSVQSACSILKMIFLCHQRFSKCWDGKCKSKIPCNWHLRKINNPITRSAYVSTGEKRRIKNFLSSYWFILTELELSQLSLVYIAWHTPGPMGINSIQGPHRNRPHHSKCMFERRKGFVHGLKTNLYSLTSERTKIKKHDNIKLWSQKPDGEANGRLKQGKTLET